MSSIISDGRNIRDKCLQSIKPRRGDGYSAGRRSVAGRGAAARRARGLRRAVRRGEGERRAQDNPAE
eukprot:scaffold329641_cov34-Prasinocladus_malaysianus.AAC.1